MRQPGGKRGTRRGSGAGEKRRGVRGTNILRRPKAVEEAIRRAEMYARETGVPLTLERVAACLGVSREVIRRLAEKEDPSGDERRVCEALRKVYLRCNADLIESLMTKNNSGTAMLARSNFGYGEASAVPTGEPVIFVGEEELAP